MKTSLASITGRLVLFIELIIKEIIHEMKTNRKCNYFIVSQQINQFPA